jgi:MFS family permease
MSSRTELVDASMQSEPRALPASARPAALLAVLIAAVVTATFEVGMMYSALPTMSRQFADPVGVGWLITAFLLVSAAATAVCSRLGDLFGRGRLLLAMLLLSVIGSSISALAPSLAWVIIGRSVQGASEAIMPLSFGLVREHLAPHQAPYGISVIAATAAIGAGFGVLLGGVIVDHLPWQSLFFFSAALSLLCLLAAWRVLPPSRRRAGKAQLDVVGGLLFVPAIATILFAITKAKTWGWLDHRTLGVLASGVVALALWARYEWRHPNPLIDVRQLARRQVGLTNIAMALFGLGAAQAMLVLLMLLQQPRWTGAGLALSATIAGALKLPANLMGLLAGPWCGRITVRDGARRAMLYGSALLGAGWCILTLWHGSFWFIAVIVLALGFSGTMVYAAMPNLIVEATPEARTSEAVGLTQVVRATATAVGAQVATFLLATTTVTDPARGPGIYPSAGAYDLCFAFITLTAILCLLTTLAMPGKGRMATPESPRESPNG